MEKVKLTAEERARITKQIEEMEKRFQLLKKGGYLVGLLAIVYSFIRVLGENVDMEVWAIYTLVRVLLFIGGPYFFVKWLRKKMTKTLNLDLEAGQKLIGTSLVKKIHPISKLITLEIGLNIDPNFSPVEVTEGDRVQYECSASQQIVFSVKKV